MTDLMAIKEAVESRTGVIFTPYAWQQTPKDRDEWGTITMDGQADAVWGDGHMEEQGLEGSVHLFTRSVTSGAPGAVQQALNALGLSWRLNYVNYESDARILHYEWLWREWGAV